MKSINQKKLAEIANVSVSTVSKAFSNSKEISEDTKNKIFAIAKEYGCFNKYYNETLDIKVIGVIANETSENDHTKGLTHLEKRIRNDGNLMLVTYSNYSKITKQYLADYLINHAKVDGLILFSSMTDLSISNPDIPIVSFENINRFDNPNIKCDCILSNHEISVDYAISHLIKMGHTDIAFIGEPLTKSTTDAFVHTMNKYNLPVENSFLRISKHRLEEAGRSEMNELLTLTKKPTAIFCAYDTIALGAIAVIKEHRLSVPDDFSIIGRNDVPSASTTINLTTVRDFTISAYDTAYETILKHTQNPFLPNQSIMIHPQFIERGTVKKIF